MNNSNQSSKLSSYLGIVSPCSSCSNKRAVSDPSNGFPACPRRAAILLKSQLQNANLTTIQVDPLVLTGNEDNPDSTSDALVNPVYSTELNTVLVWVATIIDNPGILDPSFDTNTINCREKPVIPADNEAVYRTKGAWSESDQLHIHMVESQQTVQSESSQTSVLLTGFANKVNFSYSAPRVPQDRDYSVSGT